MGTVGNKDEKITMNIMGMDFEYNPATGLLTENGIETTIIPYRCRIDIETVDVYFDIENGRWYYSKTFTPVHADLSIKIDQKFRKEYNLNGELKHYQLD